MKEKILFNKVTIIGVGLIGGSIGMALKKKRLAKEVIGLCHRRSTINLALRRKAIDKGTLNLKAAIKDADLIILATPIKSIIKLAHQIIKQMNNKCILTDVGSSKFEVVNTIERNLPNNIKFVPAHPLAGSEKKGVKFASSELFINSVCILTPTKKIDVRAMRIIRKLWQSLGAEVKILDPSEHDDIISFVSHLPHMLAFSLINSIPKKYLKFVTRGLQDSTRIAASDPLVWRDICLTNSNQIVKTIKIFELNLSRIKRLVRQKKARAILKIFQDAKTKREVLSKDK